MIEIFCETIGFFTNGVDRWENVIGTGRFFVLGVKNAWQGILEMLANE
jgi:hypothetical protein